MPNGTLVVVAAQLIGAELFATALLFLRVWAVSRRNKIVGAIFVFLMLLQTVCGALRLARLS